MSKTRSVYLLLLLFTFLCLSAASASGECAHASTQEKVVPGMEPSCIEPGVMGLFCTICGEQIKDYEVRIEPLGHDFHLMTLRAPTCTQYGEIGEKCSRCGLLGDTDTVTPTGHRAGNTTQINSADSSCTREGGYDLVVRCDICHEVMKQEHVVTPVTGHVPGNPVKENAVPGSCTQEGGYDLVVRCSVCNAELERTFVPAGGGGDHSLGSSYIITEPTCRQEGLSAQDCMDCGYTEYSTLGKTGHVKGKSVDEKVVKPTCTEYGSYEHVTYCGVCGTVMERLECNWKALGHDWGEWVTVQKATYDEKGMMQRVCLRNASHVEECEVEKRIRYTITEGAPSEDSDSVPPPFKKTETDDHGDVASHFTELKYDGQRLTKDKYYTVK